MHLPSAGMIRFRFDGFASLHLSPSGHPEVSESIAPRIGNATRPDPPSKAARIICEVRHALVE